MSVPPDSLFSFVITSLQNCECTELGLEPFVGRGAEGGGGGHRLQGPGGAPRKEPCLLDGMDKTWSLMYLRVCFVTRVFY